MSARRKKSSHFRFISLRFVLALFLLGSIFLSWKLYRSWQKRIWVGDSRFSVVVASKNPKIYSYSPQSEKMIVINIPEKTQILASGDYGNWFAGSLWELGLQEGKKGELLRQSLQNSLGLPIDGWIEREGESLFEGKGLGFVPSFFKATTSGKIKTNLGFFDRLNLLLATSRVGLGGQRKLDLETQGVLQEKRLADGEDALVVDQDMAKVALVALHDDLIFAESKRIVVINSSEKPGLAGDVGRLLSTLGVRVVGTQTNKENIENCIVRGSKANLESLSAQKISQVYNCSLQASEPSGPTDLEIVLGESFAKKY